MSREVDCRRQKMMAAVTLKSHSMHSLAEISCPTVTMRQRSGPQRGGRRRIQEARNLLGAARGHAPANNIERADDAGQEIFEVVGDAARQLAANRV
jgi:hypothetical protein